jgi:hypothetical protein
MEVKIMSYSLVPLEKILNSYVESNVEPKEILVNQFEQRLCWDIHLVNKVDSDTNETLETYVYHEVIFKDKTRDFLEQNKDNIKVNPLSFDPEMLNGYCLK